MSHIRCNAQSKNCRSGCCKSDGNCAKSYFYECYYPYDDFTDSNHLFYNSDKYCFENDNSCEKKADPVSLTAIIAGGVGGFIALMIIIGIIIYCCKRKNNVDGQAVHDLSGINPGGSHTIVMMYGGDGVPMQHPGVKNVNTYALNNSIEGNLQ